MSRWRVGLGASPGCPQPNAGLEDGRLTAPLNRGQSDGETTPRLKPGAFWSPASWCLDHRALSSRALDGRASRAHIGEEALGRPRRLGGAPFART